MLPCYLYSVYLLPAQRRARQDTWEMRTEPILGRMLQWAEWNGAAEGGVGLQWACTGQCLSHVSHLIQTEWDDYLLFAT